MRTHLRACCAAAFVATLATATTAQQPADVSVLVERASGYVESFQREFGSVVAEERNEQKLRRAPNPTTTAVQQRGGTGPVETTLVSDFLLVEVKGEGWLPFRDVFERDGKPVRDREERHRHRFEFKLAKRDASRPAVEIEFRETARPTFVAITGGRDLPVRGRFWIDETDGTVLRPLCACAHGGAVSPAARPDGVHGVATYSRFRRFQVSTSEELVR